MNQQYDLGKNTGQWHESLFSGESLPFFLKKNRYITLIILVQSLVI
jgi:hypothetical protein